MNHQKHLFTAGLSASLGFAAALLTTATAAAENPGTHRHGHGQIQVAIEGDRVDLIFTSPAYNLAGFERDARTPEEKARLEKIKDWLGTQPLIDTEVGSCSVRDAHVRHSGAEQDGHGDEHGHDDHHGHHGHQNEEENHREYEVSQQLECRDLSGSQSFNAVIMVEFPDLEELAVQWVSEAGQGSARLENGSTRFTLAD